jgi:hypothetical protein
MSTFTEDPSSNPSNTQPQLIQQQQQSAAAPAPQQIIDSEIQTPWSQYVNSLNSQYQKKIQKYAQYSNYTFNLCYEDGQEEKQVFTRKKLLQWQFDELEDLRAEASELAATSPRKAQKALKDMYEKAASFILWNVKKEHSMTADEYKHCEFSEVRPALDASMLLGLVSDPK